MSEQLAMAQALQSASATREDSAGIRGELEALQVQNAALLDTLKLAKTAPLVPPLDQIDLGLPICLFLTQKATIYPVISQKN